MSSRSPSTTRVMLSARSSPSASRAVSCARGNRETTQRSICTAASCCASAAASSAPCAESPRSRAGSPLTIPSTLNNDCPCRASSSKRTPRRYLDGPDGLSAGIERSPTNRLRIDTSLNTMARGLVTLAALAVGVAALAAGAPAGTPPLPAQKAALKAIQRAASAHSIEPATAAAARGEVARAARLIRDLPSGRREHVAVALGELASFSGRLTQPRALTLVGVLKANDDYFSKHYAPSARTDVTDEDGVVYRYFAGRCLEFHPLANFGALNARVAANDADGAQRLAAALAARGVYQPGGGIAWEYPFPFSGGRPGWTSGMAQAVGAQALARTAELVPDDAVVLRRTATAAFRTIPKQLLTAVSAGPWIKLYSFGSLVVLNAQLQAVVSLQSYADVAADSEAAALAERMRKATAATLARFDSGYWSYYALPGDWSPLDYQQFVVGLLKRLGATDERFASAATRFAAYAKQPPAFKLTTGSLGSVRFWLSKPATVTATTGAGPSRRLSLSGGWHTVGWAEPKRPGFYAVHVSAVDWAGNRASFDTLPLLRAAATAAKPKPKPARRIAAARSTAPPPLAVGAGVADPGQASAALAAGLRLARFGVSWPAGAAAPDPALVATLQQLPARLGIVVDLYAAPADDAGRAALAQYGASLVQQVPSIRDVLLAPAPTVAGAPSYAATLTALRNAVAPTGSAAAVGPLIDGAVAPKATLTAVAAAGAEADVVGLKPAPAPGKNLWTVSNLPQAVAATAQAFPNVPPVLLDGVVATPASAAALISGAACSPTLQGIVLEQLTPDPRLTAAVAAAQRGTVVCPGFAAGVDATTVTFPDTLAPPAGAQVVLGCSRDCLYLVTLVRSDGAPVVAKRGALRGGAAPATLSLPRTTLKPGTYTVDIRLVAQVNPGPVTRITSPELPVG